MELTEEQKIIIGSSGNIRINAVAGSGKTTTIIEYARTRPKGSRILYLAFNRSVKLEAAKRFAAQGLHNVKVETAHSLAYRKIVYAHGYQVNAQGYKSNEIVDLLKITTGGEKHTQYILANHINKCFSLYCNSDRSTVDEIDYLHTVTDPKARALVSVYLPYIINHTKLLFRKMEQGDIGITHDFYLKKFQLSQPRLDYDQVLFDEGQDASAAMLHVFMNQDCTRLIVGDTHQQIYGWRYAVNSLERTDFPTYQLSHSFRFGKEIAGLAMTILGYKSTHLNMPGTTSILGCGNCQEERSKVLIARTNLGLLMKAIEYVTEKDRTGGIYFEGNIHSYTYADDGASLYDVLNLFNGNHHQVRDKMIREMQDISDLEEYIRKTEDVQLGMMVEIVKKYGNSIPSILKKIKDRHVPDEHKDKAALVFSTVHRCKGMEYDCVELAEDFITEEKLKKFSADQKEDPFTRARLNEEINLLYVAVTRTKNVLSIPESLLPPSIPECPQIKLIKKPRAEEISAAPSFLESLRKRKEGRAYIVDELRLTHRGAYRSWTQELDAELTVMFCEGKPVREMAAHFGRTEGSIVARIKKLELHELYG